MYETLKEETVLAERDHNENRKKKRKKSEDEMTPPL